MLGRIFRVLRASPPAQPKSPFEIVELCEGRQLLSAAPTSALVAVHAPLGATALLPNLVGHYTGTIKVTGANLNFPVTFQITRQKPNGRIEGVLIGPVVGFVNFSLQGKIDAQGKFSATYDKNNLSGKIQGKRARNGNLSGNFNGEIKFQNQVQTVKGTFNFKKQPTGHNH